MVRKTVTTFTCFWCEKTAQVEDADPRKTPDGWITLATPTATVTGLDVCSWECADKTCRYRMTQARIRRDKHVPPHVGIDLPKAKILDLPEEATDPDPVVAVGDDGPDE